MVCDAQYFPRTKWTFTSYLEEFLLNLCIVPQGTLLIGTNDTSIGSSQIPQSLNQRLHRLRAHGQRVSVIKCLRA